MKGFKNQNNRFLKLFAAYGLPFGFTLSILYGLSQGLWYGVIRGIISGILFGLCMAVFIIKFQKRIKKIETTATETVNESEILFSSCVSLADGFFPKIGWLLLTKTHLIYTGKTNKKGQQQKIEISLSDIQGVSTHKFRMNSNAINVAFNGKECVFLMDNTYAGEKINSFDWVAAIQAAIAAILDNGMKVNL